jgi:hypothetical protein
MPGRINLEGLSDLCELHAKMNVNLFDSMPYELGKEYLQKLLDNPESVEKWKESVE